MTQQSSESRAAESVAAVQRRCVAKEGSERVAAQVVAIDADGAWIEVVEPRSGCGRCYEPGGCGGVSLINGIGRRRFWFARAQWSVPLASGDPVWVETLPGAPLAAAWHMYGLPLAIALVAAIIGQTLAAWLLSPAISDAAAALLFILGLGGGWWRAARRLHPVVRIVPRHLP